MKLGCYEATYLHPLCTANYSSEQNNDKITLRGRARRKFILSGTFETRTRLIAALMETRQLRNRQTFPFNLSQRNHPPLTSTFLKNVSSKFFLRSESLQSWVAWRPENIETNPSQMVFLQTTFPWLLFIKNQQRFCVLSNLGLFQLIC